MTPLTLSTHPATVRQRCRTGQLIGPTPGLAPGFVQANLVILPQGLAFEFLLFCQRNGKPCPVLDVTDVGDPEPKLIAPGADVRTDLPRYHIFRQGHCVDEVTDIRPFWRDDLVAFLIGCSFTFETAMAAAGLPVRHVEEHKNVPMYRTNRECLAAGRFRGPLVVSMRPLLPHQIAIAVMVTSRYHKAHGAPVHIGDPGSLGIPNLHQPDYGDAVTLQPGEVPVFWACGVTTQMALLQAQPEFAITHAPGHMFISDLTDAALTL